MSEFTRASVERRLRRGAYKYPDQEWLEWYHKETKVDKPGKRSCAPAADWWFACLQVAERYELDVGKKEDCDQLFKNHDEEIKYLLMFYRAQGEPEACKV